MKFCSNHKAQCFLGSIFGVLDDKYVCVGSIVLKRKQGLSDEQAAACPGTLVDLVPTKLEDYGMRLMLKRIKSETDKQFYFCDLTSCQITDGKKLELRPIIDKFDSNPSVRLID